MQRKEIKVNSFNLPHCQGFTSVQDITNLNICLKGCFKIQWFKQSDVNIDNNRLQIFVKYLLFCFVVYVDPNIYNIHYNQLSDERAARSFLCLESVERNCSTGSSLWINVSYVCITSDQISSMHCVCLWSVLRRPGSSQMRWWTKREEETYLSFQYPYYNNIRYAKKEKK